jgi:hypothetical protein
MIIPVRWFVERDFVELLTCWRLLGRGHIVVGCDFNFRRTYVLKFRFDLA